MWDRTTAVANTAPGFSSLKSFAKYFSVPLAEGLRGAGV